MTEYIEREAARNIFTPPLRDPDSLDFWEWLQSEIDAIPAADVRPVVLCRDCRHRDPEDHKCDSGEMERQGCPFKVADNYFCAYGER